MLKFRKRVSVVEAVRWPGNTDILKVIPSAIIAINEREGRAVVTTPDGHREARAGDWIVRDASGAYLPMSDEIFKRIYEAA